MRRFASIGSRRSAIGNARRPRGPRGFTLAELMVVITVIVLLLTVAAPSVSNMMQVRKSDAGLGAIKAAVASARAYAGENPPFSEGTYQGVALLVTPSNELRLVRHVEAAASGGTKLVNMSPPQAGYTDTADSYIVIPDGVGLVGITRGGSPGTGPPLLLAPPFAIRFDRHGHQIVRQPGSSAGNAAVYYDGVAPISTPPVFNTFNTSSTRSATYNPEAFDAEVAATAPVQTNGKYNLPFEEIEAVAGVIAYSKSDLRGASSGFVSPYNTPATSLQGGVSGGGINASARDWLLANGKAIFFNRYTGNAIAQ